MVLPLLLRLIFALRHGYGWGLAYGVGDVPSASAFSSATFAPSTPCCPFLHCVVRSAHLNCAL